MIIVEWITGITSLLVLLIVLCILLYASIDSIKTTRRKRKKNKEIKKGNKEFIIDFEYFQPNPYNNTIGDCMVRALSKLLDIEWDDAFEMIYENAFEMKIMMDDSKVMERILKENGYSKKILEENTRIGDFQFSETVLVYSGTHAVVVDESTLYDSYDSRKNSFKSYWSEL